MTDHERAALIAAQIPGVDPSLLSINMVKGVLATAATPATQEQAALKIACKRWLGTW